MIFSSYEFIFVFLPLVLGSFLILCRMRRYRLAIVSTILFSLGFYTWWNPPYVFLIIALIIVNYCFGTLLVRVGEHRKLIVSAGVAVNLAVLAYFKYADFIVFNLNAIFGLSYGPFHILLPLAISFFTFQKIALLVDVYRGQVTKLNFIDYCLFVVFFPQLIAGPIVHYRDLQPQFETIKKFGPDLTNIIPGVSLFLIGLFKKVVIADGVARYATPVFAAAAEGHAVGATDAWIGALAYTFQLYFDFSGYSDMAIGLALMFSIKLPINFDSPYKATSIIDFWRRWHITLSHFLRDYLYIPLGGNRRGEARRHVNLMITMLLGGLWHGAGWTFIMWGGLHGLYLVMNHLWREHTSIPQELAASRYAALHTVVAGAITFLAVVVAWVFFRAQSFGAAITILRGMCGLGEGSAMMADIAGKFVILGCLYVVTVACPNSQEIISSRILSRYDRIVLPALGAAGFVALMLLSAPSEFLYFRF